MNPIKAKCRKCGKEAPSDSFRLHYLHKMMVCPDCFSGRTEQKAATAAAQKTARPAGWDAEDEYLEKASRMRREEQKVTVTPITNSEYVQYLCGKCKYNFRYHPVRHQPRVCPYCDTEVLKVRAYNSV